jgi:hypothetical protein
MSTDEQRVRTMCGWIGVEISRSRVRTPGRAGYGLYRVRGSALQRVPGLLAMREPVPTEWTAYAFTLRAIEQACMAAIECGRPSGPAPMRVAGTMDGGPVASRVLTRWTPAYRGLRDLGARGAAGLCGRPRRHEDGCLCLADRRARWLPDEEPEADERDVVGEGVLRSTVRSRQRAENREFQAEHLKRREHGLKARHAAKLARGETQRRETGPPAQA